MGSNHQLVFFSYGHLRFFRNFLGLCLWLCFLDHSQNPEENTDTLKLSCLLSSCILANPIGSMYGIFTYTYHKYQPNVGVYTIHGSYGNRTWIILGTRFVGYIGGCYLLFCQYLLTFSLKGMTWGFQNNIPCMWHSKSLLEPWRFWHFYHKLSSNWNLEIPKLCLERFFFKMNLLVSSILFQHVWERDPFLELPELLFLRLGLFVKLWDKWLIRTD